MASPTRNSPVWRAASAALLAAALLRGAYGATNAAPGVAPALEPVRIDYYYEPGCSECFTVSNEVLPRLEQAYAGFYSLHALDLGREANYVRLVREMERLGDRPNAHVYLVFDGVRLLAGVEEIEDGFAAAMDARVAARLEGGAAPAPEPDEGAGEGGAATVRRWFEGFTLLGVAAGGLVDGINPCAIATLVFLVSVLSLSRTGGLRLLAVGGAFCAGSFLTYFAIGFGLLKALHALWFFHALRRGLDLGLMTLLAVLAALSFRDAWRYARTGSARDVALRLPDGVRDRIHRLLRAGLGGRTQALTAFGIGAAVTALESVCTGQVYVPTLALIVRSGQAVTRGLAYLLVYNLMFIVPLVVVLVLVWRGLKVFDLAQWNRRHVAGAKVLLGVFFLGLAAAMLLMR